LSLVKEKEAEGGSRHEEKEVSLTADIYCEKTTGDKTIE
jgi:hypothetical protein